MCKNAVDQNIHEEVWKENIGNYSLVLETFNSFNYELILKFEQYIY